MIILKRILFALFFFFLITKNAGSQPVSSIDLPEADRNIFAWMNKKHVAGLAACIIKSNRIVWSKGYGWANIEKKIPFTPHNTIFQIASVSKTITATAIMQLYEKHKFKLDDDINKYLPFRVRNPKYPDRPITFKHLLTHTSSIHDSDDFIDYYTSGDPEISLEKYVTEYFKKNNFKGYLSLEYEADEDSKAGIEKSLDNIKKILSKI